MRKPSGISRLAYLIDLNGGGYGGLTGSRGLGREFLSGQTRSLRSPRGRLL